MIPMLRFGTEENNNNNFYEPVHEYDGQIEENYFTDKNDPNRKYFYKLINNDDLNDALDAMNKWHGNEYRPDVNINFYIEQQNNSLNLPYRVRHSLKSGLGEIINSTYPLILTSNSLLLNWPDLFPKLDLK
jgi:hypothetical protein